MRSAPLLFGKLAAVNLRALQPADRTWLADYTTLLSQLPKFDAAQVADALCIYHAPATPAQQRRAACDTVIYANLAMVLHLALRARRANQLLQDLVSAGNLGLRKAVDAYDPQHPTQARFSTYVGHWIRQEIQLTQRTDAAIPLPVDVYRRLGKLRHLVRTAHTDYDRQLQLDALAAKLNWTEYDRRNYAAALRVAAACDRHGSGATLDSDAPDAAAQLVAPGDNGWQCMRQQELKQALDAALRRLTTQRPRLLALFRDYHQLDGQPPQSISALARQHGYGRDVAAREIKKLTKALRHVLPRDLFRD